MRAKFSQGVLTIVAGALIFASGAMNSRAQAPEGPQGGKQQGAPPVEPKAALPQQKPQEAGASIAVEVPVVTMDVIAATNHGDLLTGLKKENFRIIDDGVAQTISNFGSSEAPITIVMLMEFSSRGYYDWFAYQAKYWADAFFPNLKNKDEVRNALYHLYFPGFSESNVFDAILDTTERLKDVKGKKAILVLATGVDTFSKHTLDQTMKLLRQTDTTIFCVGLDKPYINFLESRGRLGSHMDYLQGENQLKTFAQMTGGFAWFPQFDGEIPGIFQSVTAFLRNQYSLSYTPTTGANDGKFHKVKVELVAPDGGPLDVKDQKGKKQKVVVYAREGYTAVKGGVGD